MRSTVTVRRAAGGPALLLRVRCAVHCAFPLIARHSALSRYLSGTLGLRPRLLGQVCVWGEDRYGRHAIIRAAITPRVTSRGGDLQVVFVSGGNYLSKPETVISVLMFYALD